MALARPSCLAGNARMAVGIKVAAVREPRVELLTRGVWPVKNGRFLGFRKNRLGRRGDSGLTETS